LKAFFLPYFSSFKFKMNTFLLCTNTQVRNKIKLFRREVHNGIVGARTRGAEEAKYDVIVFMDSHGEACDGEISAV
jgi:glycosyltransferase involved in cell wall biosynthesis